MTDAIPKRPTTPPPSSTLQQSPRGGSFVPPGTRGDAASPYVGGLFNPEEMKSSAVSKNLNAGVGDGIPATNPKYFSQPHPGPGSPAVQSSQRNLNDSKKNDPSSIHYFPSQANFDVKGTEKTNNTSTVSSGDYSSKAGEIELQPLAPKQSFYKKHEGKISIAAAVVGGGVAVTGGLAIGGALGVSAGATAFAVGGVAISVATLGIGAAVIGGVLCLYGLYRIRKWLRNRANQPQNSQSKNNTHKSTSSRSDDPLSKMFASRGATPSSLTRPLLGADKNGAVKLAAPSAPLTVKSFVSNNKELTDDKIEELQMLPLLPSSGWNNEDFQKANRLALSVYQDKCPREEGTQGRSGGTSSSKEVKESETAKSRPLFYNSPAEEVSTAISSALRGAGHSEDMIKYICENLSVFHAWANILLIKPISVRADWIYKTFIKGDGGMFGYASFNLLDFATRLHFFDQLSIEHEAKETEIKLTQEILIVRQPEAKSQPTLGYFIPSPTLSLTQEGIQRKQNRGGTIKVSLKEAKKSLTEDEIKFICDGSEDFQKINFFDLSLLLFIRNSQMELIEAAKQSLPQKGKDANYKEFQKRLEIFRTDIALIQSMYSGLKKEMSPDWLSSLGAVFEDIALFRDKKIINEPEDGLLALESIMQKKLDQLNYFLEVFFPIQKNEPKEVRTRDARKNSIMQRNESRKREIQRREFEEFKNILKNLETMYFTLPDSANSVSHMQRICGHVNVPERQHYKTNEYLKELKNNLATLNSAKEKTAAITLKIQRYEALIKALSEDTLPFPVA